MLTEHSSTSRPRSPEPCEGGRAGCPQPAGQALPEWRSLSIDPRGWINVSCTYIIKIGEHFRALFHSKWDLVKCYGVNRSITAPESENIVVKIILPMGSQGHFCDFMAAGRSQNIPPAVRAGNKGRARVCSSWQLGNPLQRPTLQMFCIPLCRRKRHLR